MAEWKLFFLLLCLHLSVHYSHVTFGKFTPYPLTTEQARRTGWKKDASCSADRPNFFDGNRYVNGSDDATRLIFDCDGSLAGMQATFDRTDAYPTIYNQPPWISTDDGRVALTVYFRDPKEICICKHMGKKPPIGDRLWIQMTDFRQKKSVMMIPLSIDHLAGTLWVEGTCVEAMGRHYVYNFSIDLDCDKILPIFLLFSQETKSLIGFMWAVPIDVPSAEWEKVPPSLFGSSMNPETTPACLINYDIVSAQHIYFVDPLKIVCA